MHRLGAHAGALIYLLAVHEPDIVGSNMDVVTVELAPIDSTPDAVERDLASAPETMVEFEPVARFAKAAGKAVWARWAIPPRQPEHKKK